MCDETTHTHRIAHMHASRHVDQLHDAHTRRHAIHVLFQTELLDSTMNCIEFIDNQDKYKKGTIRIKS